MAVADDKKASVLGWLKRLWPLLLLLAAMALVFAMGWHRYLTLQELVERREALRTSIAGHTAPRHPCLHGDLCRDRRSLPAWGRGAHACRRVSLRVVLGRARLGCGRHHGRHHHLSHRPQRARRAARRPRRALACEAPRRIQGGCFQLSPVLAPRPHLPVLARQSRPGAPRRRPFDLSRLPLSLASFREVLPIPSQAKG